MKKTLWVAAALMLSTTHLSFAQGPLVTNPVIVEVGGQQIRQAEFMQEFYNNVGQQLAKKPGVTFAEKRAALEEYVELYATFRAKLLDAHQRGFDTTEALQSELARYRKELAAPYLIDSSVLQQLLTEAYERNHYSLHAAHILVPTSVSASPDDTAAAYDKAWALYRRIVEKGEDFFAVSAEQALARNPGAEVRPNEGDLGYFTVFDMVYPFETAAYGLQVGEVSKPVRTRYGYHIIKLLDRVEGLYGKVTMAHIWLHSKDSATRQAEINFIYSQLVDGASFEQMARRSDDRSTASKGGELTDASLSQLPPEYIHELVGLKEGEFSKPFFTQYGWHIVKLIKRDTLPGPEDLEGFYKQRMTRDQRGKESRKTFASNIRKKYGIKDLTVTPVEQPKGKNSKKKPAKVQMLASLDEIIARIPDSVFGARWVLSDTDFASPTTLIVTPSKNYTTRDVAEYIHQRQKREARKPLGLYVSQHYGEFLDSVSLDYADSQLEKEYPEFAQVVDEYRRGLMIFNYNDAMIWRKAMDDSAGFANFYARESRTKSLDKPEDSIYFFHPRARLTVIDVLDANALPAAKAQKIVANAQKKNMGSSEMKQMLTKKIDRKKYKADELVKVDVELVEQTRQHLLQDDQWQRGVYMQEKGSGYRLLVVDEVMPRSLKGIKEARGYYLNAWQNEVERQLNDELREKYNVKVHHDVVQTIVF